MGLWKRRNRDDELDEEIRSHLHMAARDRIARGQNAKAAQQAARRELGNIGLIKEVTRDMWGWTFLERSAQDVRYGLRVLRRSPGYAAVAILSLALGIGANTAIFSLIDAVMLKSLPVRNPQELVTIGNPTRTGALSEGTGGNVEIFSYPFFERLRARNAVFTDVFARSRIERLEVAAANGSKAPGSGEATRCRFVTGNYFSVLGVSAGLGRTFTDSETRLPGAAPLIVISDGYWKRQFGRKTQAIGRTLVVNGSKFTIIGVTPPAFSGETVGAPADIWFPATMLAQASPGHDYLKNPQVHWLLLMGRLRTGVSLGQAAASVNVLGKQIFAELYKGKAPREEYAQLMRQKIEVSPGAKGFSRIRHDFSLPLMMLMGTVALVLLICCANVANLQLARAAGRRREMSLRLAVGAGRGRLLRQLVIESLLLAAAGAALALCFAVWASRLLLRLTSANNQLPVDVHLDGAVLLFTAGVAITAGLLFGLFPAWQSTRIDLVSGLKENKSGAGQGFAQSLGKALIVGQVTFSVVLLAGAGVCTHTLENLKRVDVGYAPSGLLLAQLDHKTAGYTGKSIDAVTRRLLDKLREIPGVEAATVSENGLFSGTDSASDAKIEGYISRSDESRGNQYDRVGPNYFQVVGTPVLAGRGILPQDVATSPLVAVINEKMAKFYFPHENPIGRHIIEGDSKPVPFTIVGVVRNAKQSKLREAIPRRYYSAYFQHTDDIDMVNLEIRTRMASAAFIGSVRRAIHDVDPHLAITSLESADQLIDDTLDQEKLVAKLSSFFGVLALVLAGVGLYGVMSYMTARRTMEIGIRMALGAEQKAVINLVLNETFRLVAIGLALGIGVSICLIRLLPGILFGLSPFDPVTLLAAAAAVVIACALAAFWPAWRASRVDPTVALRYE